VTIGTVLLETILEIANFLPETFSLVTLIPGTITPAILILNETLVLANLAISGVKDRETSSLMLSVSDVSLFSVLV
jgi:hypothetical protein